MTRFFGERSTARGALHALSFASIVIALLLIGTAAQAQVKVYAEVEPSEARPNQQFNYSIVIENGNVDAVPTPRLPLQIVMASAAMQSNEFSMDTTGRRSVRARFSWALTATEPGDFVIPAQAVQIGGQVVNTNEVKIAIKEGAQPETNGLEPLLQISVDKTEFYQSEVIPIKAQLYVHRNTQLQRLGLVDVKKTDFAIQRFPQQSEQSLEMVGGQPYYVLTFRSTLSALKTGRLEVGPASMEVVVLSMERNRLPGGFLGMGGEPRKVTAKSIAVPVTVLPLPAENKPAGFSGAVGDFTLNANASPTSLATGEPITVELSISGIGNFDALTAPALTDPAGWKTYPTRRYVTNTQPDPAQPNSLERQIGFTQVLVPEKQLPAVPPFEMSFFSPTSKQYVTLRTQPIPLAIKAGAPTADGGTGTTAPLGDGSAPQPKARTPEPEITDILEHLPASPDWITGQAKPLHEQPLFWVVNAIPSAFFCAVLLVVMQKRRRERLANAPDRVLRDLWQELHASGLGESEFYRRAAHFIHAAGGDESGDVEVQKVLARYEALNFSGTAAESTTPVSSRERSEVLGSLAPLLAAKKGAPPALALRPATAAAMLLIGLVGSDFASPLQAASSDERYKQVVDALAKKDYNRAQAGTESLLGEGALSPELFEIMGHTRYRQGDHGRAVLWYERALLFTPRVPEIRQNLRHLDDKVRFLAFRDASPLHTFGLLLQRNTWLIIASAGGWLLLIGAGIVIVSRPGAWRNGSIAALVIGALLLPLGATGAIVRPKGEDRVKDIWVVTSTGAKAYTAASTTAGTVIDLPPGSQIRLLEKRGAWNYVEIPATSENLRGWIESDTVTTLWPSKWPVAIIP